MTTIKLPMARSVFPTLSTTKLVSVQPMKEPITHCTFKWTFSYTTTFIGRHPVQIWKRLGIPE
jgi:hypothetical protein